MKYIALIGDIISSKNIQDRLDFQNRLSNIFQDISIDNSSIVSPYTITLGDEFQALYKSGKGLMVDIVRIMALLYPVRIRFSIGIGKIDTEINKTQALGMDGSAFHIAREGIIKMKNDELKSNVTSQIVYNNEVKSHYFKPKNAFSLVSFNLGKLSKNQLSILFGLLRDEPVSHIAGNLKISEQAVYKSIIKDGLAILTGSMLEYEEIFSESLK